MPWVTERQCHGLDPDMGLWDQADRIVSSYQLDHVLVYPTDLYNSDRQEVDEFLSKDPNNKVVLYSMIDPDCAEADFSTDRICYLTPDIVYWEFYSSINCPNVHTSPPTKFTKDFLCYQRKPTNHRPEIYQRLKDRNGIVTLGSLDFDFNKEIVDSDHMIDVDYERNPEKAPKCRLDIDTVGNPDIWDQCFLNFVSETVAHPDGKFISEKTFKPIMGKRPFITFGAKPGYYQVLKNRGYETFEDDFPSVVGSDDMDSVDRLADFLETFDKEAYYADNVDKFEHNYQVLCEAQRKTLLDFKNFIQSIA